MLSRRRGAIVNIGSAAGVSSCPLLAEYGAAKSYIATLSKGIDINHYLKFTIFNSSLQIYHFKFVALAIEKDDLRHFSVVEDCVLWL